MCHGLLTFATARITVGLVYSGRRKVRHAGLECILSAWTVDQTDEIVMNLGARSLVSHLDRTIQLFPPNCMSFRFVFFCYDQPLLGSGLFGLV